MARHTVAVAVAVLIHTLLRLVSAMPGPAAPSRSVGPRLQCPHCHRSFKTHANFRTHQAAMANRGGQTGCGRDVPYPTSSGWSSGSRAAGAVADLSGPGGAQREAARLAGIDDSDSDSSGRGGRRQVDHDGGGQDHPAAADSEEEAGPAVPDAPAGDGGAGQVHTYQYLVIHADTNTYIQIHADTNRYMQIHTHTYKAQVGSHFIQLRLLHRRYQRSSTCPWTR